MFKEQEPLVSIITLNYNQTEVTCEFLDSTRKLAYKNYEILLCDMASDVDPTPVVLAGNYPNTRILVSNTNLGFAGGNNWGMRHARGDFIFIVNNDTEVTAELLNHLLQPFKDNAEVGVTSPKILYYDNPDTIQYAGFRPINPYTGRTSTVGEKEKDRGQHDLSGPTPASHGCAMMVKREVIEKTGMLPEKFFLYYEEWDWSTRIRKAGYTIWYTAEAVIYHKGSVSIGEKNPLKVYYLTRNRILFMRRNMKSNHLLVFYLFFTFFAVPKSVVKYIIKGHFKELKYFISGAVWNFNHSSSSPV
jgi:GT2 family glycosyltransferase